MRRRNKILIVAVLLLAAAFAWHWQVARGPVYEDRHITDWVDEALSSNTATNAQAMILQIGEPAVPYIARQGLYGRSHVYTFLASDRLRTFSDKHHRISVWLSLRKWDHCVPRHQRAVWLLSSLGTKAQAAVPDLINCLEHCPEIQSADTIALQDTLAKIGGTNSAVIEYFTRSARANDDLHAAVLTYQLDGRTNLLVETCEAIALKQPQVLAFPGELSRFRADHALNQYLVPLFEKIYFKPKLNFQNRAQVMSELEARGDDATNAIAHLQAGTSSP